MRTVILGKTPLNPSNRSLNCGKSNLRNRYYQLPFPEPRRGLTVTVGQGAFDTSNGSSSQAKTMTLIPFNTCNNGVWISRGKLGKSPSIFPPGHPLPPAGKTRGAGTPQPPRDNPVPPPRQADFLTGQGCKNDSITFPPQPSGPRQGGSTSDFLGCRGQMSQICSPTGTQRHGLVFCAGEDFSNGRRGNSIWRIPLLHIPAVFFR